MKLFKKILKAVLVTAFWVTLWTLASLRVGMDVLLPSPAAVAGELLQLAATPDFWLSCANSLVRILAGLLIGAFSGLCVAVLTSRFSMLDALISPVLTAVRSTPVASFIILALVWIGRDGVPTFASFLMVLPVVWGAVSQAIRSTDPQLLEVTKVFRFSPWKKLKTLYTPTVFPVLMDTVNTSLGLAWKAGVAAEVLCTPKNSIGTNLYESKMYLQTASLFAWTATVILLSLLLENLLGALHKRLSLRWKGGAHHG